MVNYNFIQMELKIWIIVYYIKFKCKSVKAGKFVNPEINEISVISLSLKPIFNSFNLLRILSSERGVKSAISFYLLLKKKNIKITY